MKPEITLSFTGKTHRQLRRHLFPGDEREAAAILLCTRAPGARVRLLVSDTILVPHDECPLRERDALSWPGDYLAQAINQGERNGSIVILMHSHPGGLFGFSHADNQSDQLTISSIFAAYGEMHGSAVMTDDGAVRARLYTRDSQIKPVDLVTVAGDELMYWWSSDQRSERPMAFTGEMTEELGALSAAVIGVSGTGSIVAEELARLGLGQVTLIDFDQVEPKNLNRILNTTSSDAAERRLKVEAFAEAIGRFRGPGVAVPIAASIASPEALIAAGQCDLIFTCVDTMEARYYADLLATAFHLPLFDVGVSIKLRKNGSANAIGDVSGRVDYVQPGGSTLQDRGVYSPQSLRAEYTRSVDPEAYLHDVEAGYIQGLAEEAPAVISLNMRAAAACVNDFLARAYPFRLRNSRYAQTKFSLATCEEQYKAERDFPRAELYSREQAEQLLNLDCRGSQP